MAPVLVGEGQVPDLLARPLRGVLDPGDELVVVAHEARDLPSQGDHARTGQSGQVDDGIGILLGRQRQPVGQHQATLGVGVQHLDGLAVASPQHVAGLDGATARHVLGGRHDADHPNPDIEVAQGRHGRQHRGRPRHVGLHRHHAVGRLERQPSRIEGDPLAHQGHRRRGAAFWLVDQLDQTGRLLRALGDSRQAAQPLLGDLVLVQDLHAQAAVFRDGGGDLGQAPRRQRLGRFVHQVAGQGHGPGDTRPPT